MSVDLPLVNYSVGCITSLGKNLKKKKLYINYSASRPILRSLVLQKAVSKGVNAILMFVLYFGLLVLTMLHLSSGL